MPTPEDTMTAVPPEAAVDAGAEPTAAGYVDQDREVREPRLEDPDLDLDGRAYSGEATDLADVLDLGEMDIIMSVEGDVPEGSWIEKALHRCAKRVIDSPEFGAMHIINRDDKVVLLAERTSLLQGLLDMVGDRRQNEGAERSFYIMLGLSQLTQAMLKAPARQITYDTATDWLSMRQETFDRLIGMAQMLNLVRPVENAAEPTYELTGIGVLFATLAPSGLAGLTRDELVTRSGMSATQVDKHLERLIDSHAVYQEEDRYVMAFDGVVEQVEQQPGGLDDGDSHG